jgi:hypothetical protein
MPSSVDVGQLIEAALEDRRLCRMAGLVPTDANAEVSSHLLALANRLRDRIGPRAAMRAAFTLWNELEVGAGETLQ